MSSPKAVAARTARRPKSAAAAVVGAPAALAASLSDDARRVAAEIERALAEGRSDTLSPDALQALMAALCRNYSAQVESGGQVLPLKERGNVSSTEIMMMASALLRSANLAVFELGMWQSWTGR